MILFISFVILLGIMVALVVFVKPVTVDMYVDIPLDSVNLSSTADQGNEK